MMYFSGCDSTFTSDSNTSSSLPPAHDGQGQGGRAPQTAVRFHWFRLHLRLQGEKTWRFTEDTKRLCELLLTRLFNLRSFPASTHKSSPCWTASWTTGRNGTLRRKSTRPNSKSLRSRKPPRLQLQQVRDAHFGMNVFTIHGMKQYLQKVNE